jgi:hypothetical protein
MKLAFENTQFVAIFSLLICIGTHSQDLNQIIPQVGNTFCTFLAQRNLVHRKMFGECSQPKCSWDTWNHALHGTEEVIDFDSRKQQRVVISYGHNGNSVYSIKSRSVSK